jgi:predicted CoA-binding protein
VNIRWNLIVNGSDLMAQSVAVLGASTNRSKYSNKAVRAYADKGWTVYPVNPKADTIEGHKCYPSIRDLPGPVDRVSIYLPPALTLETLPDIAAAQPGDLFLNPGAESDELVSRASELGLNTLLGCSIIDIGARSEDYPA